MAIAMFAAVVALSIVVLQKVWVNAAMPVLEILVAIVAEAAEAVAE